MNRKIRVKVEFVLELHDEGEGLPRVPDPGVLLAEIAAKIAPGPATLEPGGRVSVGLTRESSVAFRRLRRARTTPGPKEPAT